MPVEWKVIEGFPGYMVSNTGKVKSFKLYSNGRLLKPCVGKSGYPMVKLSNGEQIKTCDVHRLVAYAFLPNPDNLEEVNHIDGNKKNANVKNLEWVSKSENCRHRNMIHPEMSKGERNPNSKLNKQAVKKIYKHAWDGKKLTELAEKYGINTNQVSAIKNGRAWVSVTNHYLVEV
jgi:hypothetical protein